MNGISIVAKFRIIEKTVRRVNRFAACLPVVWIFNPSFTAGLFQITDTILKSPFLTAADLTLVFVRFLLVFSMFNCLFNPNGETEDYSIIS